MVLLKLVSGQCFQLLPEAVAITTSGIIIATLPRVIIIIPIDTCTVHSNDYTLMMQPLEGHFDGRWFGAFLRALMADGRKGYHQVDSWYCNNNELMLHYIFL